MDNESNNLRIAFGSAFVLIGLTLLGLAMNGEIQSKITPWWVIPFMVIGVIALIVGLLILRVSPKRWKIIECLLNIAIWQLSHLFNDELLVFLPSMSN
jgi:hypothetical protein